MKIKMIALILGLVMIGCTGCGTGAGNPRVTDLQWQKMMPK